VRREAQGLLLFLVGAAVLRVSLSDLYQRYVKTGLRPLLIMTGVVLIIAAIATIWYELRSGRPTHSKGERRDGHRQASHEPWIAWLLLLPVFALILVVPPALGSYAANRAGTVLQPPVSLADLPPGDPLQLSVLDYATRAVYDHGRSFDGRRIKLTGFITVGPHGAPYLTRMVLNCCAADAQPIKVGLSGQVPSALQPDAWLEIVGTYTDIQIKDDINNGPIPFIVVIQATPVPAPHDQYES
jgi:uncharacterized repeat protein (TIGR03943 family)